MQTSTTTWFFSAWVLSHFSRVQLLATLWTITLQAPLSMGFSRQEYWSGLPCPPLGDLPPAPGIEPSSLTSPALAGRFVTTSVTCVCVYPRLFPQLFVQTPTRIMFHITSHIHTCEIKVTKQLLLLYNGSCVPTTNLLFYSVLFYFTVLYVDCNLQFEQHSQEENHIRKYRQSLC